MWCCFVVVCIAVAVFSCCNCRLASEYYRGRALAYCLHGTAYFIGKESIRWVINLVAVVGTYFYTRELEQHSGNSASCSFLRACETRCCHTHTHKGGVACTRSRAGNLLPTRMVGVHIFLTFGRCIFRVLSCVLACARLSCLVLSVCVCVFCRCWCSSTRKRTPTCSAGSWSRQDSRRVSFTVAKRRHVHT